MPKSTAITFTPEEISVIDAALFDYQRETEGYLTGYMRKVSHDPCCETYRAAQADWDVQRASLESRLAHINSALDRIPR